MSFPVTVTMRSRVALYENGTPTGEESATGVLRAEGEFCPDSGRLTYTEKTESGETFVALSFPPDAKDTLTVERRGASDARFLLKMGAPDKFIYGVPPFRFSASVELLSLDNRLTARGGRLSAVYFMTLGGQEERISWNLLMTPKEETAT